MLKGLDIVSLAQEIQRQSDAARDFVTEGSTLGFSAPTIVSDDARDIVVPTLSVPTAGDFPLTSHAQGQIAGRLGIPTRYFDRMRDEAPGLLEDNVRHWLGNGSGRFMVRTLDSGARAVLSDRYLRMDNLQVAEMALPALLDDRNSGVQVVSCNVTPTRLYLEARFRRVEGEVVKGDPVQMGVIVTNSEIGMGAVEVRPLVYRLVCTNGMVAGSLVEEAHIRRTHLGGRIRNGGLIEYAADTVAADATALALQIRDSILALADGSLLDKFLERARAAAGTPRVEHPVAAVEELARVVGLRNGERESVLENLIRDRDYSAWGMANAVTAAAHAATSYDRNIELQELGGRVIDLSPAAWRRVAEAEPKLKMAA